MADSPNDGKSLEGGIVRMTDSPRKFGAIDLRMGYAAGEFPLWSLARSFAYFQSILMKSNGSSALEPKRNTRIHE